MIRRVIDGDGKHVSNVFKKATGSLIKVESGMLDNGARHYNPPRMQKIVIERAHDTHIGPQATKNMVILKSWWLGTGKDVPALNVQKTVHQLRKRSILGQTYSYGTNYI